MYKVFFIVVTLSSLLTACNDEGESEAAKRKTGFATELKTKEDSLYHDVMEGHDIGMAKMNDLRNYLALVKHSMDSLSKLPASKIDEVYQQGLIDAEEDLNYADYSMFTWMGEFKADTLRDKKELRIKYLEGEKEKVTKMKENILSSIHRADSVLKRR